ncbi:hypothetical protein DFH07DRAFT_1060150 [Mycena maculata]|uniref:Uncharacterized protein n=1 Tax=Mycena maculata TaxID=230809 RepID=A0AAD7J8T9_9AGAR|nr:hypothetical protein DFH07DRAFT_1060150 [Mycena maculata]
MLSRLFSFYHDIRHVMRMDSLPAPSTLAPGIAPVFFPITDENRNDRMSLEATFSAIPFTVHTSLALQRQMIGNGDSCSNLRITKVEYFQRDVAPLHEFISFSYEDVSTPGVSNFMVIERWGTDFQPPDNTKEKVERHTLTLDNGIPEPTTTFSEQALFVSKASARQPLELSGKRTTSIADDRVIISWRRIHHDIEKIEPGKRTLLATMTPPPDSTISVAEILALASFISKHSPVYDLLESCCFYYGRAIFDVTRTLMHCTGADIVTTDDFSFMKSDALQWHAHVLRCLSADKGPVYMVKSLMADKVKTEFGADAIIEKYKAAFAEFEESVRAQKERNERPLRLAEERLQEEVRARQEEARARQEEARARQTAELEVERLKELVKSLQGARREGK